MRLRQLGAAAGRPSRRVIGLKRMSAGRLGNDMFVYASLVGIAAMNQMVPVYKCDALNRTFHVTASGNYVIVPFTTSLVEESAFRYAIRSAFSSSLHRGSTRDLAVGWAEWVKSTGPRVTGKNLKIIFLLQRKLEGKYSQILRVQIPAKEKFAPTCVRNSLLSELS